MSARALLARVQRLEAIRRPSSPFVIAYGSLDAWEAECRDGVAEGKLDGGDVRDVMMAVRRWHREVWVA